MLAQAMRRPEQAPPQHDTRCCRQMKDREPHGQGQPRVRIMLMIQIRTEASRWPCGLLGIIFNGDPKQVALRMPLVATWNQRREHRRRQVGGLELGGTFPKASANR